MGPRGYSTSLRQALSPSHNRTTPDSIKCGLRSRFHGARVEWGLGLLAPTPPRSCSGNRRGERGYQGHADIQSQEARGLMGALTPKVDPYHHMPRPGLAFLHVLLDSAPRRQRLDSTLNGMRGDFSPLGYVIVPTAFFHRCEAEVDYLLLERTSHITP